MGERKDQRIKAISYSDYHKEKIPRTIIIGEKNIDVVEIIKMYVKEKFMS